MIGSRTGKSPTVDSVVTPMVPSMSVTSVDVPPMSKPMMRGYPAATRHRVRANRAGRGPRQNRLHRRLLRARRGDRSAVRLHDAEADATPSPPPSGRATAPRPPPGVGVRQPLLQRREIARHQRRDVGVDDGGAEALEFAVFRQHAMRGGHGEARRARSAPRSLPRAPD